MKIIGYSERGMLNSIIYSMNTNQMKKFIALITKKDDEFILDDSIEILIEQSLSDFGDADLIIMYSTQTKKHTLFIEAKVKTYSQGRWSLVLEYNRFKDENRKNNGSNLFRQLALKKSLVTEKNCANTGIKIIDKKVSGNKDIKRIGSNEVVLKAFKKIVMSDEYQYIGIIPVNEIDFESLAIDKDYSYIKFIKWCDIYSFIQNESIIQAQNNFEFNFGQIF